VDGVLVAQGVEHVSGRGAVRKVRDRSLGLGFWESIEDVASFTISGIVVRRFRAVAGLINVMPWRILYSIPHCPVARLVPEGTESLGRLVSWYG
jgi:hypothetical protein